MAETVDLRDVIAGLGAMRLAAADLRPVWREVLPALREDIHQHFASHEGPEGAWAPRARSSVDRIRGRKGNRRRSGRLRGSFTRRGARRFQNQLGRLENLDLQGTESSRSALELFSRVAWADVHQEGGTAGHGARIPARPFNWASDRVIGFAAERVVDHVLEAW